MTASDDEQSKSDLAIHKILPPKPELYDHPSYLFWKVQSQLVKLNYRLNRTTHHRKPTSEKPTETE
ncbi:hypothetical protein QCB45_10400 [Thiomicrorhabdus sp. ZW0627]|uniref:hypothetical protein n=1 Tax=Thiomicrorhabdus sp. ZW0627 TaxID=3039774 RepID=UPI002436836B|nr:hypothetical protein [Thiomicrorhabdus sp. ZW0627]MDG6774742.1 hypothetical protein [Thiomicrorhabdus sp. ZW0627]